MVSCTLPGKEKTWSAKQREEEEERAGWDCAGEVQYSLRRYGKHCIQFFENTSGFSDQTVRQVEWGNRRRKINSNHYHIVASICCAPYVACLTVCLTCLMLHFCIWNTAWSYGYPASKRSDRNEKETVRRMTSVLQWSLC